MKLSRRAGAMAALVTAAVSALALTGCSAPTPSDSDSPSGDDALTIAMILNDQFDPFYLSLAEGAQKAADELGIDFSWQAPTDVSAAGETTLLQSIAATKPDAIIMSVIDKDALVEPMKQVMDSGIPIITVDADTSDPAARLATVASDSEELGGEMAKAVEAAVGGSGTVGYIGYLPGVAGVDARLAAFTSALEELPDITYIGEQFANLDASEYTQKAAAVLAAHPEVGAIATSWANAAIGVSQAVQQAGKGDSVKVIGFDASPDEIELLKQGQLAAVVVQAPYDMGDTAVRMLVDYLKDGTQPKDTYLPGMTITPENVDSDEVAPFLPAKE